MLLRVQTLWILISVVFSVASFELPFAAGKAEGNVSVQIDSGSSIVLITLTSLSVALSSLTMLNYTNLVRQKTLCWLGIMLGVVICLIFLKEWRNQPTTQLTLTCLLPLANPLLLWLAWLGIKGDQKLLKNLGKRR